MRKAVRDRDTTDPEILPEYDFSGGIRGKHAKAYAKGHTVRIHRADKTVVEHRFTLEDGAVMLEPDVREYFSDSEAVNAALRTLIRLAPRKRRTRAKAQR